MKKQSKRSSIVLCPFLLLCSCDSRMEDIGAMNAPPEIAILTDGWTVSELTDSVRIPASGDRVFYNLQLVMDDPDNNLKQCKVLLDSTKTAVYYNGSPLRIPSLRTDQRTLPVSLSPLREGSAEVVFELADKFNGKGTAKLILYAFENLAPEAMIRYDMVNGHEVELDASGSYDRDHRYGGRILSYTFSIDGVPFETHRPKVRHVFPQKGNHAVALKVMDNSGAFSKTVELRIDI